MEDGDGVGGEARRGLGRGVGGSEAPGASGSGGGGAAVGPHGALTALRGQTYGEGTGKAWGLEKSAGVVVCSTTGRCLGPETPPVGLWYRNCCWSRCVPAIARPRAKFQPARSGCILRVIHCALFPSAGGTICNDCDYCYWPRLFSALLSEMFRVGAAGGNRSRVGEFRWDRPCGPQRISAWTFQFDRPPFEKKHICFKKELGRKGVLPVGCKCPSQRSLRSGGGEGDGTCTCAWTGTENMHE